MDKAAGTLRSMEPDAVQEQNKPFECRSTLLGALNLGLTDTGRAVLTGTVFVALASLIVPAFGVLSALVSILAVSLLVGLVLRPRIAIAADIPDSVIAGRTLNLNYTVKNLGPLPLYNLWVRPDTASDALEYSSDGQLIPHLAPGATAEVIVTIRAIRRGRWPLKSPACRSSFPFNLFRFSASVPDRHTLVVLPSFFILKTDPARPGRHLCTGAGTMAGRMGSSTEYAGNRPFIPGDSLRDIDARAWARLSTPATREYHDDLDTSAALILDTTPPDRAVRSESGQIRELEAAVSLCASVAFSINPDRLINLLLIGNDLHEFTAQPRDIRLDKTHRLLADVEPSSDSPSRQISEILTERFTDISELFFILLRWNKPYQNLLQLAENAGCHCTALVVGEPDRKHLDRNDPRTNSNIRFISPEDILAGKMEYL